MRRLVPIAAGCVVLAIGAVLVRDFATARELRAHTRLVNEAIGAYYRTLRRIEVEGEDPALRGDLREERARFPDLLARSWDLPRPWFLGADAVARLRLKIDQLRELAPADREP